MDYQPYFIKLGWKDNPFTFKIDPNLFVGYESQTKQVISFLNNKQKVALLLGPTGSGKTTLLKWIEVNLRKKDRKIIYISKIPKNKEEYVSLFLSVFPLNFFERLFRKKVGIYNLPNYVNKKLGRKHLVLLIDESHEGSIDTLEWLRTLSDHVSNLSIILAGLPILEETIRKNIQTLYERVTEKIYLNSLNKEEMIQMIRKRITYVGGKDVEPFTYEALDKIYELTGGFPRSVLKACSKVLEYAVTKEINKITPEIVEKALKDLILARSGMLDVLENLTPKQRQILEILAKYGPSSSTDIVTKIDLSVYKSKQHAQRAINNTLKKLYEKGILLRKKEGGKYIYYLSPKISTVFAEH